MHPYLKKTCEYAAGNLFRKLLLLFLLPILTKFLIPREFAVYTNITIFISFASLIYFLGIQQALFSYFYQDKSAEYRFSLISSVYITLMITSLIFSFLIYHFRIQLSQLILKDGQFSYLFTYVAFILFFDVIYGMTLSFLNIMELSVRYAFLGASKNLSFLILVIIGAFTGKISMLYLFQYLLIASIFSFLLAIIHIIKILNLQLSENRHQKIYSAGIMKNLISFGLIMIPGTLAMVILRLSDRYMLTYLSANSLHDVGIYAIGYKIGMIMAFLTSIVSMVYFPYAMKIADQPGSKDNLKKIFNSFLIFGSLLGMTIILFSQEIFRIFIDGSYHEGIKIVFFGVMSHFLLGVFNIINISFYIKKKARIIAFAVGLGALINIILNIILIPSYGVYGAGFASIIAYIFIVLLNFITSRKIYDIGFKFGYIIISLLILTSVAIINFIIEYSLMLLLFKIFTLGIVSFIVMRILRNKKNLFLEFNSLINYRVKNNEIQDW